MVMPLNGCNHDLSYKKRSDISKSKNEIISDPWIENFETM